MEKDVDVLESAIEDIEEELEEVIESIEVGSDGSDEDSNNKAGGEKVHKIKFQLTELLDLIKDMKKDSKGERKKAKKGRMSLLEDVNRLKEEMDTLQEEKEMAEEKMYEQGNKIRRLMEENKELKKKGTVGGSKDNEAFGSGGSGGENENYTLQNRSDDNELMEGSDPEDTDTTAAALDKEIGSFKSAGERITSILKLKSSTLDHLFGQEELHEELANLYGARDPHLTAFLSRPPIVSSLVDAIVSIQNYDPDDKEIPALPFTASEILTSGITPLTDMVCQTPMLQRLFSLLDNPPPLPASSPVASLWYKVMAHYLQTKSMELSLFIKESNILSKVVNHINSECVLNLLLTMLNTEAKLESYGDEFQWSHLHLIDYLASKLDACAVAEATLPDWPNTLHYTMALDNISEFLCEILTKYPFSSPLVLQMQEIPFVRRLVRNCLSLYGAPHDTGLYATRLRGPVHCLQILVHLLALGVNGGGYMDTDLPPVITELLNDPSITSNANSANNNNNNNNNTANNNNNDNNSNNKTNTNNANPFTISPPKLPGPINTISAILKSFVQDINRIGDKKKILLGEYRMRILSVAVGLARTGYFIVDQYLLDAEILQSVIHIFFSLHWNNMLHTLVSEFIVSLLPPQSPSSRSDFCMSVLQDMKFVEKMLNLHLNKSTTPSGLMGHIATMAIAIQRASNIYPPLQTYLSTLPEWSDFAQKMAASTEISWNV